MGMSLIKDLILISNAGPFSEPQVNTKLYKNEIRKYQSLSPT
jgi:hypothetical protein